MDRKDYALIAKNSLFNGMDFTSVEYILELCSIRDLIVDEALITPEISNHSLYLILEGELAVHLVGQETMKYTSLFAGDYAGDISMVDGKMPSALVVAAKPTRVLAVPHDTVWSLINHSHEVARNLLAVIGGRIREDNRALISSQDKKLQFEHQASVDALTGIHNRRWMFEAFPRALLRCRGNRRPVSIMLVDIDFFKQVNDTHGHQVGDDALRAVAKCMTKGLRPFDLLVRYGGEEFAVLLPDTDHEKAMILSERLRGIVADTTIQIGEISLHLTISIGVASTRNDEPLEELLEEADRALYRAKGLGRNRVEISNQEQSP